MVSPAVQPDLFSHLIKFRFHRIVLSADIAKMYRQFALSHRHKGFLRLLWLDSPGKPLQHLRMTRVMYGVASSACQSTRCLKEIGNLTNDKMLKKTIQNDFYVNYYLSGADNREAATFKMKALIEEQNKYGLPIQKLSSDDETLILSLPENLRETPEKEKFLDKDYKIKTLGIRWTPNQVVLVFNANLDDIKGRTKRAPLSDTARRLIP